MQPLQINAFYCFYKPQQIWFLAIKIAVTDSISLGFPHASLTFLLGPEETRVDPLRLWWTNLANQQLLLN